MGTFSLGSDGADAGGLLLRADTSKGPGVVQGGATRAYLLSTAVLQQIKSIDPNLDVEWRPQGRWWTSFPEYKGKPPAGATPGCWRIICRGGSGKYRGLRLWPPDMADGRLVAYLREHWAQKWQDQVAYKKGQAAFNDDLVRKNEIAHTQEKYGHLDPGPIWRATKAEYESPKWRPLWNVAAGVS